MLNDKYENFVTAHIEPAAECIPNNSRTKYRVPKESTAVREKQDKMKIASLLNKRNSKNANIQKLNEHQKELIYTKKNR